MPSFLLMPLKRCIQTGFLFLACFQIAGCISYDPEFKNLASAVETNPKPDAILGMWYRKEDFANFAVDIRTRNSLLFKPDGTCAQSGQQYVDGVAQVSESDRVKLLEQSKWRYLGSGQWELITPYDVAQIRLASGKLLLSGGRMGVVGHHVYSRIE
jgi:hypothetical protein